MVAAMAGRVAVGVALLCALLPGIAARPIIIPNTGPCSGVVTAANTFYVYSVTDFAQRLYFPNSTTVLIYISNNITLTSTLVFGTGFSCTIFQADPALAGEMPFLHYPASDKVAVMFHDLTNVMVIGVGFAQDWQFDGQLRCNWASLNMTREPWIDSAWTCPGTLIYSSFNVLISQAYLGGRVDIWRSADTEITYSTIVSDNDYWPSLSSTNQALGWGISYSTVRFLSTGDPVNLYRGNNKLMNNVITGSWTTVFSQYSAVGNIVQNNYITGFQFGGLQCGMGMQNVADCMLNSFELNYIQQTPGVANNGDGAGIYYDLHWFNPGNRDSCNYVEGTSHCIYVDYTSSGLLVEGLVCINTQDGVKVNTGSFNEFRSIVLYSAFSKTLFFNVGYLSCQNWCFNRCAYGTYAGISQAQGIAWWSTFTNKYNNDAWAANYPYLQDYCTRQGYTVGGIYYPCNPNVTTVYNPGGVGGTNRPACYANMTYLPATNTYLSAPPELTGNCSGMPKLNSFDLIFVTNLTVSKGWASAYLPTFRDTCNATGDFVFKTNLLPLTPQQIPRHMNMTLGFNDEMGQYGPRDFGADDPSAPIYQQYPNFYSCPRRLVGPQTASFASARSKNAMYKKMNKHPPKWHGKADPNAKAPADFWEEYSIFEYVKKFDKYKQLYGRKHVVSRH